MTKKIEPNYETTKYNLELIEKYIKKENGLFLLPSPTGSGKTHAIIDFISKNINSNSRFIYTVPIKNTLEDFKDKLLLGLDEEYHDRILILRSLSDELKFWFESLDTDFNNYEFSSWNEFKKIELLLNTYKVLKNSKSLNVFDDNELYKAANLFITRIKKQYSDYLKNENMTEAKLLLKDTKKIFKSFDIEKYSIILTTTSKFSHKIKTISSSEYLWDFNCFENAVLFMDEFDSQKAFFLNSIISTSLHISIDLIELFRLMTDTFMNMKYDQKFNYDLDSYNDIKKEFIEIYKSRKLNYVIDTKLIENELDNLPILIDSSFNSINLQNSMDNLHILIDKENEQLEISQNKTVNSYKLSDLLKELSQLINRYVVFSRNHLHNVIIKFDNTKLESKKQLNKESFINAKIHDNIKIFGLSTSDKKYKYLSNQIKTGLFIRKKFKKSLAKRKWNFYQNGFSLVNINKMYLDSNLTDIEYFNLNNTPEAMLIEAASKLMIVGVSATANINSVIKNFDLDYLKSEVDYVEPSIDEIKFMQELYLDSKRQRDREFEIKLINNFSSFDQKLIEFCKRNFSKQEMHVYSYIKSCNIKEFTLNLYMNFVDCYREFLLKDDIHSLLYFSNRYIKQNNELDRFNYRFLFDLLVKLIHNFESANTYTKKLKQKVDSYRQDLKGLINDNILFFEYKKETEDKYDNYVCDRVLNDEKVFVYANYKRIGTGKNLEYFINENEKKDFDAVFLEKPTNLIQRSAKTDEEKLIGIFQIESLARSYIISSYEYREKLKALLGNSKYKKGYYSKTNDNIEASMYIIIQAIGRLHRTNTCSKMYLFIDSNLVDIIKSFKNNKLPLLPSTAKLLDFCSKNGKKIEINKDNELNNELNELSNTFSRFINYSLKVFQNPTNANNFEEVKEVWNSIRSFVLKYPTFESKNNTDIKKYMEINNICHLKMNKNHYTCYQQNDYKKLSLNKIKDSYSIEVSEKAANLHLIKSCYELEQFAIENEISLTFSGPFILTPIVFNNIYKGALGEVFGKYIIEKYCNIELSELSGNIDEKYESFDYKCEDFKIYFDFKYYSMNTLKKSRLDIINKAKQKLEKNKLNKALIINIFAESEFSPDIIPNDNVIFIPYLVNSKNQDTSYIDNRMIESIKGLLYGE